MPARTTSSSATTTPEADPTPSFDGHLLRIIAGGDRAADARTSAAHRRANRYRQFLDALGPQWGEGLLADKTYAGFTSAQTAHGGHESTLLALYNTLHHFGGILVAPGYTDPVKFVDGNPYGVSHATGADNDEPLGDAEDDALAHLAERIVTVTGQLKRGREA